MTPPPAKTIDAAKTIGRMGRISQEKCEFVAISEHALAESGVADIVFSRELVDE
jgi:hypothetical protein